MRKKKITITVDEKLLSSLRETSKNQTRSLSNQISYMCKNYYDRLIYEDRKEFETNPTDIYLN